MTTEQESMESRPLPMPTTDTLKVMAELLGSAEGMKHVVRHAETLLRWPVEVDLDISRPGVAMLAVRAYAEYLTDPSMRGAGSVDPGREANQSHRAVVAVLKGVEDGHPGLGIHPELLIQMEEYGAVSDALQATASPATLLRDLTTLERDRVLNSELQDSAVRIAALLQAMRAEEGTNFSAESQASESRIARNARARTQQPGHGFGR